MNMKSTRLMLLLLAMLPFAGCGPKDPQEQMKRFVPEETDAFAQNFIQLFSENNQAELLLLTRTEIAQAQDEKAQRIRGYLTQHGPVLSKKIIGYQGVSSNGSTQEKIEYEFEYENAWRRIQLLIVNKKQVASFFVRATPESIEKSNGFNFSGKSIGHYGALVWTVAYHLLVLGALILCLFSKIERKWLWMLVILFGNISTVFNWSSGYFMANGRISFGFNFGVSRAGLYGPWYLTLAIPVGALCFFLLKKKKAATK